MALLLGSVARRQPVLVVLDDVHLADASSWEALQYLVRNLADDRLLVVATARSADLATQDVAARVLFGLDQDGLLTRIELGPLVGHDVGELTECVLDRPPPPALVEWLIERSQGNPLFVLGLVRALQEEGANLSAPELRRLPEALTERVASRMRELDEPSRAVLELLAVVGRRVELDELVRLTARPLEELGDLLERLVTERRVTEEERGRSLTYELNHPLVQDAIYQLVGRARRRVLHRRVARALLDSGRLTEAAPHFARAAEPGDPEAIEVLLEAVGHAEGREAYREALELTSAVVELLPPGDERWLALLGAVSWQAEWVVDHRSDTHALLGVTALRSINSLLETSTDTAQRAAVKLRLASFLAWGTGELKEAAGLCLDAQRLFEGMGERRQALLAGRELAWITGLQGDLAAMEEGAEQVLEDAEVLGERFVTIQALGPLGYGAMLRGRFRAAEAVFGRAIAMAREDGKTYRLTVSLVQLAFSLALEGRADEAVTTLDEARSQNPAYRDTVLVETQIMVSWLAGDFRAAVATAREALAWNPARTSRRRAMGMVFAALAAIETRGHADAHRFLARGQEAFGDRDWSAFSHLSTYGAALLAWQQGRPSEALAGLQPTVVRLVEMEAWPFAALILVDLAQVAAQNGDVDAAVAAAARLEAAAQAIDRPLYEGMALVGSAWAALASGPPGGGIQPARRAADLLSGARGPCMLARALDVLGRSLARDEPGEAVTVLEQAAVLFEAGGAVWRREASLETLRTLGSRGRRATAAALGPASLTRREREVARLAAEGRTAREIAEQLFVSERTVETHLTQVYAKLGVASKLDLVRQWPELAV
jgi:ATP/maltotriose-dependent transcriptional regulator MalT